MSNFQSLTWSADFLFCVEMFLLQSCDIQQRWSPHYHDNQGENELVTWDVACDGNEDQLRESVNDGSSVRKLHHN